MLEQHPAPEPDKWFPWPDKLVSIPLLLVYLVLTADPDLYT